MYGRILGQVLVRYCFIRNWHNEYLNKIVKSFFSYVKFELVAVEGSGAALFHGEQTPTFFLSC